jgi:hypothetical protein
MSLEDQTTLLIECFEGKIEIAIKTDSPKTRDLVSDWSDDFNKSSGADNLHVDFIETGKPSTAMEGCVDMGVRENLVVGFFLITMKFSFSKMEESFLKDVLLISTDIAALILGERKKALASQKENKRLDDGKQNEVVKTQVEIIKERHENIVLQLDMNNEEDINKLMNTIYLLNENHGKEPSQ